MITVRIYSGSCLIESKRFKSVKHAEHYASYWQDDGFRVRIG